MNIGNFFEQFVASLKTSCQGIFDAISATLGFVITALKNILLIDSNHLYASILFGVLLALVAGVCLRRLAGRKLLIPGMVLAGMLFGGVELWRISSINRPMTKESAGMMLPDHVSLVALLESEPLDIPQASLQEIADALAAASVSKEPVVEEAQKVVSNAIRRSKNARRGDVERIHASLDAVVAAMSAPETSRLLAEKKIGLLQDEVLRFQALSAEVPARRLIRDLEKVSDPKPMNRFLNQRSYERLAEVIEACVAYSEKAGNAALKDAAGKALGELRLLNPARLEWYAPALLIAVMAAIAWLLAGNGVAVFSLAGLALVWGMGLWIPTVESLALALAATLFALVAGIPLGIAAARSSWVDQVLRPFLDLMQTMPAFVYLIPAVIFFGLGEVPGAMATLIFSMPPAVRLTALGIRQVPGEIVEAAQAFGSTSWQMLVKAQLPIALPTILAGVNQTIMLSLSMVVIAGMIGAGGLGSVVLGGITQMKLGLGFEGGLAVVILAIYLDRVTQALGKKR